MTISIGPYKKNIPLVNLQDIRFDVDTQGEYIVTLGISNEQTRLLKKRNQKFNNFVYFSANRSEIELMSTSPSALREAIKKNPSNNFAFAPSYKDFSIKTRTEKSKDVYSYFYQKRFVLGKTDSLYVLVCSFLTSGTSIMLGNIIKETLVVNNQTPINAKIYSLAQTALPFGAAGSVWPGSAHMQDNNIMVGNTHTGASHPNLISTNVLNVRLKDLRVITAASSLNFGFTKMPKGYFSPVTLSRGRVGNINGSFTFNLLNFAKNNTKFGGLIKNNVSLLSSIKVKDIIVYQKITGHAASGNSLTPGNVSLCGLKAVNRFKRIASLNDGCSIVSNVIDGQSLLQVFFLDKSVKEVNSGVAEYKAEIIFEDSTPDLIKNLLAPLRSNIRKIVDQKNIPDSPEVYRQIIIDFLTSVHVIFGTEPFTTFTSSFWKKNLLALINKFNPNYDSDKYLFLSTMRNYIARLEAILLPPKTTTASSTVTSKIYNSNSDPIPRVTRIFKENYTFTGTRDFGLNYVDDNLSKPDAVLPSISFDSFSTRASEEVTKYQIINTQAAALNPLGYLSPRSLNLTPNPMAIDTSQITVETIEAMPLIKNRIDRNVAFTVNKNQSPSSTTNDALRGLNISARRSLMPLRQATKSKLMAISYIDSEEYLSATSNFVYEYSPTTLPSGSVRSNVTATPTVNIFDSALVNSLIEQSVTSFNPVTTITNQDQLAGSPALQKLNEDSSIIQSSSALSNAINFNSVAQVQYLASYDIKEGIAKQNWKLLTKQQFNISTTQQKPLICKLIKVSNTLGTSDILDVEPMSSLFIMGSPKILNVVKQNSSHIAQVKRAIVASTPSGNLQNVEILYSKNIPFAGQGQPRITRRQSNINPRVRSTSRTPGGGY